jgi:hypothetical protein
MPEPVVNAGTPSQHRSEGPLRDTGVAHKAITVT